LLLNLNIATRERATGGIAATQANGETVRASVAAVISHVYAVGHLAAVTDDQAVKELGERDYFKHYTDQTDRVSDGGLVVSPVEIIAQTGLRG